MLSHPPRWEFFWGLETHLKLFPVPLQFPWHFWQPWQFRDLEVLVGLWGPLTWPPVFCTSPPLNWGFLTSWVPRLLQLPCPSRIIPGPTWLLCSHFLAWSHLPLWRPRQGLASLYEENVLGSAFPGRRDRDIFQTMSCLSLLWLVPPSPFVPPPSLAMTWRWRSVQKKLLCKKWKILKIRNLPI